MGYILENKTEDGRANGWYAGVHKKYSDMFNLTPSKKYAYIFEDEDSARKRAELLNRGGWDFVVLPSQTDI